MKPNTRILNYTTLIQDGILTLDDVPQDIAKEVTKWVRYLSGVNDNGMVKDETPAPAVDHEGGKELAVPSLNGGVAKKAGD